MSVYLHWLDPSFPGGFDEEHPNTRRAQYSGVEDAIEQAAHDLAFDGSVITSIEDENGESVLDREALIDRAYELVDKHHAPLASALPAEEFQLRINSLKDDIERRVH